MIQSVFWVQAAISFAMWIASGYLLMRLSPQIQEHAFALTQAQRGLRIAVLFVLSTGSIFGALSTSYNHGGFEPSQMRWWAWALITLGGLLCVSAASLGLAYAVSLAIQAARESRVTEPASPASTNKNPSDS